MLFLRLKVREISFLRVKFKYTSGYYSNTKKAISLIIFRREKRAFSGTCDKKFFLWLHYIACPNKNFYIISDA